MSQLDTAQQRAASEIEKLLQFIEATSARKLRFKTICNLNTGTQESVPDRLRSWYMNVEQRARREALGEAACARALTLPASNSLTRQSRGGNDMILGIDIGLSGACAVFTNTGTFVEVFDLPTMQAGGKQAYCKNVLNATGLHEMLSGRGFDTGADRPMAYLEVVSAMPKQGVASMFSLGHTMGSIVGVLCSLRIPHLFIRPQDWKKAYGMKGKDKDQSRTMAIRLLPAAADYLTRKKDHNRAEACLIGRYGVQRQRGDSSPVLAN